MSEFKAKVKSRFRVLTKVNRDIYKKNAKIMREKYYTNLKNYLTKQLNDRIYREIKVNKQKLVKKSANVWGKEKVSDEDKSKLNGKDLSLKEILVKRRITFKKSLMIKEVLGNLITKMKIAADLDRNLNLMNQPTVKKIVLLKEVKQYLHIVQYHQYLIEQLHLLDVIRDWLTPLPDKSLPELTIREEMYKIIELLHLEQYQAQDLRDYFLISNERVQIIRKKDPTKHHFKSFGKLVKHLCKHPKETKINRLRLRNFLLNWSCCLVGSKICISDSKEKLKRQNLKKQRYCMEDAYPEQVLAFKRSSFNFLRNVKDSFTCTLQKNIVQEYPRRKELLRKFNLIYRNNKHIKHN